MPRGLQGHHQTPQPGWSGGSFVNPQLATGRGKPSKGTGQSQSQWRRMGGYGDRSTYRHCQLLAHRLINKLISTSLSTNSPSAKRTGQAHPCKRSPCTSTGSRTASHNYPSSAASPQSPTERGMGATAPSHTHKILTATAKAQTAAPSSLPALAPQLEPGGLCPPAPPAPSPPRRSTAHRLFLSALFSPQIPSSPPPLTARGYFSPDPGQLQNRGYCSTSLQVASPSLQRS